MSNKTVADIKNDVFFLGWGMFSDEGEQMVESLLVSFEDIKVSQLSYGSVLVRAQEGMKAIDAAGHTEVRDSDVRGSIVGAVEEITGICLSIYEI